MRRFACWESSAHWAPTYGDCIWLWVTFNELLMIMSSDTKNTPRGPEGGPYIQEKQTLWCSSRLCLTVIQPYNAAFTLASLTARCFSRLESCLLEGLALGQLSVLMYSHEHRTIQIQIKQERETKRVVLITRPWIMQSCLSDEGVL